MASSSLLSPRNQGKVPGVPTPWQAIFRPGPNLANLYALYPSLGDVTIDVDTSIPSTLDGPIQVARYRHLTVNAKLTTTNRCRGLILLRENLNMGATGEISMTARGAAGSSSWVNQNIVIPSFITLRGQHTSLRAFLQWIAETGYFILDPNLYRCPPPGMGDVTADYVDWPSRGATIISAAGCGAGKTNAVAGVGVTGSAGVNAPGGGGGGGTGAYTMPSGSGRVWGGGAASAGAWSACRAEMAVDDYGGKGGKGYTDGSNYATGGGAGNPGGEGQAPASGTAANGEDGTGGVLLDIGRGDTALASGHVFSAGGKKGGNASMSGTYGGQAGAGSGGGFVGKYRAGAQTGTPNMTAPGGLGGTGSGTNAHNGGQGGVGATQDKTFDEMGWAA